MGGGSPPRARVLTPLAPVAVLVRGFGVNEATTLPTNVQTHFAKHGEWGVSCVSMPGLTALEIVAQAPWIRQRWFRWGTVAAVLAAGWGAVTDRPPHALIMLPGQPADETFVTLLTLLSQVETNPHYEERRGR